MFMCVSIEAAMAQHLCVCEGGRGQPWGSVLTLAAAALARILLPPLPSRPEHWGCRYAFAGALEIPTALHTGTTSTFPAESLPQPPQNTFHKDCAIWTILKPC